MGTPGSQPSTGPPRGKPRHGARAHIRGFSRRLPAEPTISPRVQKAWPRKSCRSRGVTGVCPHPRPQPHGAGGQGGWGEQCWPHTYVLGEVGAFGVHIVPGDRAGVPWPRQ